MLCVLTASSLELFSEFTSSQPLTFLGTLLGYNEQSKQQGMELSPHSDAEKTPPLWQEFKHGGGRSGEEKERSKLFHQPSTILKKIRYQQKQRFLQHIGSTQRHTAFSVRDSGSLFNRLADVFAACPASVLRHLLQSLSHRHHHCPGKICKKSSNWSSDKNYSEKGQLLFIISFI